MRNISAAAAFGVLGLILATGAYAQSTSPAGCAQKQLADAGGGNGGQQPKYAEPAAAMADSSPSLPRPAAAMADSSPRSPKPADIRAHNLTLARRVFVRYSAPG